MAMDRQLIHHTLRPFPVRPFFSHLDRILLCRLLLPIPTRSLRRCLASAIVSSASVAPIILGATLDHTQQLHLTTSAPPHHAYQPYPSLFYNFI